MRTVHHGIKDFVCNVCRSSFGHKHILQNISPLSMAASRNMVDIQTRRYYPPHGGGGGE